MVKLIRRSIRYTNVLSRRERDSTTKTKVVQVLVQRAKPSSRRLQRLGGVAPKPHLDLPALALRPRHGWHVVGITGGDQNRARSLHGVKPLADFHTHLHADPLFFV